MSWIGKLILSPLVNLPPRNIGPSEIWYLSEAAELIDLLFLEGDLLVGLMSFLSNLCMLLDVHINRFLANIARIWNALLVE